MSDPTFADLRWELIRGDVFEKYGVDINHYDPLARAWAEVLEHLPADAEFSIGFAPMNQKGLRYYASASWGGWIDPRERDGNAYALGDTPAETLTRLLEDLP